MEEKVKHNMFKFDTVAAIKWQHSDKPLFVGLDTVGHILYWGCTYSHCGYKPEEVIILKEYPYNDEVGIDGQDIQFYKDFGPKPSEPCARLGWIAPNGDWYPCSYTSHNDLADYLSAMYYDSHNGILELERKNWIKIRGGGCISVESDDLVTEAQKSTLKRIVDEFEFLSEDIDLTHILIDNPEGYTEQLWLTDPADEDFMDILRMNYKQIVGE